MYVLYMLSIEQLKSVCALLNSNVCVRLSLRKAACSGVRARAPLQPVEEPNGRRRLEFLPRVASLKARLQLDHGQLLNAYAVLA